MRSAYLAGLIGLALVIAHRPGVAQVGLPDAEQLLATRFGFTPAEIAQARSGQAVAKMLPSQNTPDVGVFGAVRIDTAPSRLVNWLKQVETFRKDADLGVSGRLSDPPRIEDFAALSLDKTEAGALRSCRPGACDLMLGDNAIKRFQAEVNWSAPDSLQRATMVMRQVLLGHAQAYLAGGDKALGATNYEKTPRVFADEFRQVLWQSKALYDLLPALATYLEEFPKARLAGAEQFLYWGRGGTGSEASTSLHQLVIYRTPGGDVFVADKQLFASRYTDAALTVISIGAARDGKGFYALVGARARSTMLGGVGARVLRGQVESATRETATMYLNWIRASLAM